MNTVLIKNGTNNFLKNMLYVFIPMGILYLAIIIAMIFFISGTISDVKTTANGVIALVSESAGQSSASVESFVKHAFSQINWNGNFFETLRQIIDTRWIKNTITGFFDTLGASSDSFEAELSAIISNFTDGLKANLTVAIVLVVIGVEVANIATGFVLRKKNNARNLKKIILAYTLVPLANLALTALAILLLYLLKWFALLAYVALILISAAVSMFDSYLVYRDKTLKLKEVLTLKNIMSHLVVVLYIFLFDILVAVLLALINILLAILLMVPFFIYSLNIIENNTDNYISNLVRDKNTCGCVNAALFE